MDILIGHQCLNKLMRIKSSVTGALRSDNTFNVFLMLITSLVDSHDDNSISSNYVINMSLGDDLQLYQKLDSFRN